MGIRVASRRTRIWQTPTTAAIAIMTVHLLDLITMLALVGLVGIAGEANPLMQTIWSHFGPAGVIAFKTIGAAVLVLLVGDSRLMIWIAIAAGLFGTVTNALALGIVTGHIGLG